MSDEQTSEATETDAADTTADAEPKPSETVDFWKQKSREQEKRAKANAAAASELEGIKEANKTAEQKSADALVAAQSDAADARTEALRFRIASRYKVSDEDAELFLTGTDEETITRQAERLTGITEERRRQGNYVPTEGATTPPPSPDDLTAFADRLFERGAQPS